MPRAWIVIEEPGGPGLELAVDRARPGPVIKGARAGGAFLGLDRGSVPETDTGGGTALAALVALPSSAAVGCWIEAEVAGLLTDGAGRMVIVTTLPGHPLPTLPLIRVAARMPDASLGDVGQAMATIRRARAQFRRRRSAARRTSRPAWLPIDVETRQVTGGSIASAAERDLTRLPTRFVRGLAGLLDQDERILATVERPPDSLDGRLGWRRRRDGRAAILLLTDRQLLWLVDHVPPGRYLLDWGVDAELLPLERLRDVGPPDRADRASGASGLTVRTDAGETAFPLPGELQPEAAAFAAVLARFVPEQGAGTVLRRYPVTPRAFDPADAERFRQGDEAADRIALLASLAGDGTLAAFYAPRRERVRQSVAIVVTHTELLADPGGPVLRIPLTTLRSLRLALSPLVGRVELHAGRRPFSFTYPAPLAEGATALVRTLRRAWANADMAR